MWRARLSFYQLSLMAHEGPPPPSLASPPPYSSSSLSCLPLSPSKNHCLTSRPLLSRTVAQVSTISPRSRCSTPPRSPALQIASGTGNPGLEAQVSPLSPRSQRSSLPQNPAKPPSAVQKLDAPHQGQQSTHSSKRSWVEILRPTTPSPLQYSSQNLPPINRSKLKAIQDSITEEVVISSKEVAGRAADLSLCLMGRFCSKVIVPEELPKVTQQLWNLKDPCQTTVLGMGTDSHCIYNFPKNNDVVPTVKASDTSILFKNILEAGFWWSINHLEFMDRFLNSYSRDSIRNTMLKQEETFRHQVRELHRVYRVQKMLMVELRNKEVKLQHHRNETPAVVTDAMVRRWDSASTSESSYSSRISNVNQFGVQLNRDPNSLHQFMAVEGPSSRHRGFDLEQPAEYTATECSGFMFGEQQKEKRKVESTHLWPAEEADTELTLRIGCGTDERRPQ